MIWEFVTVTSEYEPHTATVIVEQDDVVRTQDSIVYHILLSLRERVLDEGKVLKT